MVNNMNSKDYRDTVLMYIEKLGEIDRLEDELNKTKEGTEKLKEKINQLKRETSNLKNKIDNHKQEK